MKVLIGKNILWCAMFFLLYSNGGIANDMQDKIMTDLQARIQASGHKALQQIKQSLTSKTEKRNYAVLVDNISSQQYKIANVNNINRLTEVANSF